MTTVNKCRHCGKTTKTEKEMIRHLAKDHDIHLPPSLDEYMFDGGLEKLRDELKGVLYYKGEFFN